MKISCLTIFQLLLLLASGQTFNIRFDSSGLPVDDAGSSIEKTEYGYILSCVTLNESKTDQQLSFVGLNEDGTIIWTKVYGDPSETDYVGWANSMNRLNDSLFVQGCSIGSDPHVILISHLGDTLWTVYEYAELFKPLYFGMAGWNDQIIFCGARETIETDFTSGFVQSYNMDGFFNWERTYTGSNYTLSLVCAITTPDSGYMFSGFSVQAIEDNQIDMLILKTDSLGNEQWRKRWGDWDDGFTHLVNTSDGNYAVCSWSATEYEIGNVHPPKPYMAKLDTDGEIIWEQRYGPYAYPVELTKIIETQDGNLVSAGYRNDYEGERGLIVKVDGETGDSLWYRIYSFVDNSEEEYECNFRDIIETTDGCLVACGWVDPTPGYPSRDTWVMKVDSMGCLVPGCDVSILENTQQANFICYPNPASQYLNIYLESRTSNIQSATFNLYNMEGELVKCFEPDESGTTYMLDVSTLASGCYILQYTEDDGIYATRRVNVVH